MPLTTALIEQSLQVAATAYAAAEARIEALDRAIGDGDHYLNMKRGMAAALAAAPTWRALPPGQALGKIAMTLLSTIGGASGPLLASLLMGAGKVPGADAPQDLAKVAEMVSAGAAALAARGKSGRGDKTMLDVLIPFAEGLTQGAASAEAPHALAQRLSREAAQNAAATAAMPALAGRASGLGERAIGHADPGATSMALIIAAVAGHLTGQDLLAAA